MSMSLQVRLALEGNLEKYTKEVTSGLATAARYAVETYGKKLQLALRDDTRTGGLGDAVANAWRLNVYKNSDVSPAALVYSKAPIIVTAFSADTTIVSKDGNHWLAIPTDNVPRFGNKRMTPVEVEAHFNQGLIFKRTQLGTALAFVSAIPAKNGRGFRAPTKGRLSQGRKPELILMFVMVAQVHLRKRLNWPALMADAEDGFQEFFIEAVADQLKD